MFIFPYTGNFIIPTDELIFFREVQTTNQWVTEGYQLYKCVVSKTGKLDDTQANYRRNLVDISTPTWQPVRFGFQRCTDTHRG